jgi:hypothetical protein
MSLLLQQLLVAVLVIACALFSAWRLSSLRLRLRVLEIVSAAPGLRGASWLARLRELTLARQLRACGGCGGAATPTGTRTEPTRAAEAPNRTPGALRR